MNPPLVTLLALALLWLVALKYRDKIDRWLE